MTVLSDVLACFGGSPAGAPLYLADLTQWHSWHHSRGSLPQGWQDYSPAQVAHELGTPLWWSVRPWRPELPGVEITTTETDNEREICYETEAGTIVERWSLGPDGDWWHTEYPLKSARDLPAVRRLVEARSYVVDAVGWEQQRSALGDVGILAMELPQTPYSDLLHTILGWSEGLMLLMGDEREPILELLAVMEAKHRTAMVELARLPGAIALAPDNLDGQFIPPSAFRQHMTDSYRLAAEVLHAHDKRLIVHIGGMCRHLLAPLAATGVDGVEGVAGPPQSDAPLSMAREKVGANFLLWGGHSAGSAVGYPRRGGVSGGGRGGDRAGA